jgi:Concanavalin A-like lectin/glucanases superfamily
MRAWISNPEPPSVNTQREHAVRSLRNAPGRAAPLLLAVAIVVSGAVLSATPAPGAAPAVATQPEGAPGGTARAEARAWAAARSSGRAVEVAEERTSTRQVFANPDGTFTSDVYALPRWVRQGGSWADVDPSLRFQADGTVTPVATATAMVFSGGGTGPLATVSQDGGSVAMSWPTALPRPTLDGATATYPEVLPGVDLRLVAGVVGMSELLVVKNRQAAHDPRLATLTFAMRPSGVSLRRDASGSLSAVTPGGAVVLQSGAAMMWDADRRRTTPMRTTLRAEGRLEVTPDRVALTDPAAKFPLYLDPDWTGSKQYWTYVDKAHATTSYGLNPSHPYAETGYYNPGVKRSFFRMDTDNVNGKHILSAYFHITETKSYGCGSTYNTRTDLYLTTAFKSTTTWNNQPSWTTDIAHINSNYGYGSCPSHGVEFPATSTIVKAAASGWSATTFGLRAYSETDTAYWKGFDPATAKITITYNTPPKAPASYTTVPGTACVIGAGRPYINTRSLPAGVTAALKAQIYDPDGSADNNGVQAQFEMHVYDAATSTWASLATLKSAFKKSSSWQTASVAMPALQDGRTYSWRTRAYDGVDYSGYTPWCEFTVDNTAPDQVPQVASTDYPAGTDTPAGTVGRPGRFTFTAGTGETDVASFRYTLLGSAPVTVAATSGAASVTIVPKHEQTNTLSVCPMDHAGNVGTGCATYDFTVGAPTAPVASWRFDEGTGTTAADSSGTHPATLSGGAGWTRDGRVGGALHLAGSTGYAATTGPVVDTGKEFTVSAWLRAASLPTGNMTAVSGSGASGSEFYLGYHGDVRRWSFWLQTGDADPYLWVIANADDAHPVVANAWTHLVGQYDPSTGSVRLYVNGQKAGEGAFTTPWSATGAVQIGRSHWRGSYVDYWNGDLDEVKVWDRVVSDLAPDAAYGEADAEVYHLATRPVHVQGSWHLDEASGATATDASGNGRTMTAAGAPSWVDDPVAGASGIGLNGTSQYLSTAGPALRTDASFSVAAWVRLDGTLLGQAAPARNMTALSQNGTNQSGFYLGCRLFSETGAGGTTVTVAHWSFTVQSADATSGTTWIHAKSLLPVDAETLDQWVLVIGVYDAVARTIRIYVPGTGDQDARPMPASWAPWQAGGATVVGRAWNKAAATDYWPGDIDEVRAYAGVISVDDAQNLFHGIEPATNY